VKYRLFSPPDDITDGQLRLVRDQPSQPGTPSSVVANYLLQELADGSFSITVPEGVSMNVTSEEVEIRIVKPDQTTTAPHRRTNFDLRHLDEGLGAAVPAAFESIHPRAPSRRRVAVTITASKPVQQGHVRMSRHWIR
jgi:hypothetical protein